MTLTVFGEKAIELHPGISYFQKAQLLCVDVTKVDVRCIAAWERPNDWELAAACVRYTRNGHPRLRIASVAISGLVDY